MNRSTLTRDIQYLRAKPGDGVARFDHLNSMTAKRSKSPAHQPMGVPTRSLPPTPAWVWDPHRPGWRMIAQTASGHPVPPTGSTKPTGPGESRPPATDPGPEGHRPCSRPGSVKFVPDPAAPVLRSVPGVGHTPEA